VVVAHPVEVVVVVVLVVVGVVVVLVVVGVVVVLVEVGVVVVLVEVGVVVVLVEGVVVVLVVVEVVFVLVVVVDDLMPPRKIVAYILVALQQQEKIQLPVLAVLLELAALLEVVALLSVVALLLVVALLEVELDLEEVVGGMGRIHLDQMDELLVPQRLDDLLEQMTKGLQILEVRMVQGQKVLGHQNQVVRQTCALT
jgi:hypothetical protein